MMKSDGKEIKREIGLQFTAQRREKSFMNCYPATSEEVILFYCEFSFCIAIEMEIEILEMSLLDFINIFQ